MNISRKNDIKPRKPLNKFWNRSPFFYRVRNRLLFREISVEELSRINYNRYNPKHSIPEIFFKTSALIFKDENANLTDFEKALKIATWLRTNIKGGKGLGINSEDALKYMLHGGYGVCSDFCQIFNNFCVVNDIRVREWGLNNELNEKDGHAFSEFYAKELNKWIFIDVSNALYFVSESGSQLSALEVFDWKQNGLTKKIKYYLGKKHTNPSTIKRFYFSEQITPFIVDKYNNKFYDLILKRLNFLPIPFIHGVAILINKSYNYRKINSGVS